MVSLLVSTLASGVSKKKTGARRNPTEAVAVRQLAALACPRVGARHADARAMCLDAQAMGFTSEKLAEMVAALVESPYMNNRQLGLMYTLALAEGVYPMPLVACVVAAFAHHRRLPPPTPHPWCRRCPW